ncbi:MAG: DnaD domain protein [Erysipelotrichaceae bacterium]
MIEISNELKLIVKNNLSASDNNTLLLLYHPLIGSDAYVLYNLLYLLATSNVKIKNHRYIKEITNFSMLQIEQARIILEQFLLVRSYTSNDSYIYEIYPPMKANNFLANDIFGRLYQKQKGNSVLLQTKKYFSCDDEIPSDYINITSKIDNLIKDDWIQQDEEIFNNNQAKLKNKSNLEMPISFNTKAFLKQVGEIRFPIESRTPENIKLIEELGTIHGLGIDAMNKNVGRSLKGQILDKELLKDKFRRSKNKIESIEENDYAVSPILFLQKIQNGPIFAAEKKLLESLVLEYKMKPEVVNVLVEYALRENSQTLSNAYVEKIAASWLRLNIDTSEKALNQIKGRRYNKPNKFAKYKTDNHDAIPKWTSAETKAEDEEFDQNKYEQLLKKAGG